MKRSVYMVALVSAALIGVGVSAAQAGEKDRSPTKAVVSVEGVNFNNAAQVAKVYRQLKNTAYTLCDSEYQRYAAQDRQCADAALASAVRQLNQPTLTAMHEEKTAQRTIYADKGILYGAN
ncbi:UrcA family protein [Asticcacaulis sp. SL142]|uniref:UrcA family protein n=1 Tax=Asticcacaulis sp. SL142 TaxID=2995155 RepID=UPI00226CA313|nr:UrcA family protein [Asticcacaulis sp. SL142]WAC48346.1 UrcA family protein [Asticcacaulis sp. SL142]